jgi:Rrf2 family protein
VRITYKGDYALKAVLDLTIQYGKGPVQIQTIAKNTDSPVKFLEQVLLDLKRGGFVNSRRGKDGGYFLAKKPSEIRVGDVVRFIDGYNEPIACLAEDYQNCRHLRRCVFRKIWQDVAKATSDIIDNVTFDSLAEQVHDEPEAAEYFI